MKNIPKVIYLNLEERGEDFKDHTEITWSEERINDSDVRFVLSDNSVIHSVSNCSQECEWKADTFDNIGMALTEYCEECGAKRDCR